MHTESRSFQVLFSDGTRRPLQGTCIEVIMLKALTYLVGLRKDFTMVAVIDEANAKIYGDFAWDFTYSEKDREWLQGSPQLYTPSDIERAVMSYARFLGADLDIATTWLSRQSF